MLWAQRGWNAHSTHRSRVPTSGKRSALGAGLPHPESANPHRLDAITRTEVKAFARALAGRLAPVTVRSIVTVLGLVLREAIDEHYLLFDPTARLRLRDGPSEPRATATPDQVRSLAARMPNLHTDGDGGVCTPWVPLILFGYHPRIRVVLPTEHGIRSVRITDLMPLAARWTVETGTQEFNAGLFEQR